MQQFDIDEEGERRSFWRRHYDELRSKCEVIRRPDFWTFERYLTLFSIYQLISSLWVPLMVRGPIGGQHGVLIGASGSNGPGINLKDITFTHEAVILIMSCVIHALGLRFITKKSVSGLTYYFLFLFAELSVYTYWLESVFYERITSHTMSTFFLITYCIIGFVIQLAFVIALFIWIMKQLNVNVYYI